MIGYKNVLQKTELPGIALHFDNFTPYAGVDEPIQKVSAALERPQSLPRRVPVSPGFAGPCDRWRERLR